MCFSAQQVLPQRAVALKYMKSGLHHVGRYPDLKARENKSEHVAGWRSLSSLSAMVSMSVKE